MPQPTDPRQQFADQIARLQKRQIDFVQETSAELEALKQEMASSESVEERLQRETAPLVQEIALLRESVEQMRAERSAQEAGFEQLQHALNLLRGQPVPRVETAVPLVPTKPEQTHPGEPTKLQPPAKQPKLPKERIVAAPALPAKKGRLSLPKPRKATIFRLAVLALIIAGGKYGFDRSVGSQPESGEVAGVSTSTQPAPTGATSLDYSESYAELPFNQTTWEKSLDNEFGVSIEYPSNTSNRIHTQGGSNLWFLRWNGYLMKITRTDTDQDLTSFVNSVKAEGAHLSVSAATFKGQQAVMVRDAVSPQPAGYQYFVKRGGAIFEVWIKNEPPTTDDGQRLARMISSLQFIN